MRRNPYMCDEQAELERDGMARPVDTCSANCPCKLNDEINRLNELNTFLLHVMPPVTKKLIEAAIRAAGVTS